MKRFKKVLSLALACLCVLMVVSGCGTYDGAQKPKKMKDNGEPLTIYCMEEELRSNRAITLYNNVAKEGYELQRYEGNISNLSTELLAGGGPDLFIFCLSDYEYLYNFIGRGVFQDLNYYFEQDPVDWSNYKTSITDAGVFDGKRYVLPYSYELNLYLTTDKILEQSGVPEDIQLILTDFSNLLECGDSVKAQEMKLLSNTPRNSLMTLLQNYMDYDSKTTRFDSEEFRGAMEQQKELAQFSGTSNVGVPSTNILSSQKYVFTEVPRASLGYIYSPYYAEMSEKYPDEKMK